MTTFINKLENYAGDPIADWTPPVAGAVLAAWVGDADPAVALMNFGSGADLIVPDTMPAKTEAGFRDFSVLASAGADVGSFLRAPGIIRPAGSMTQMVVCKKLPDAVSFGILISNQRPNGDGGRRGTDFQQNAAGTGTNAFAAYGTTTGSFTALGSILAHVASNKCLFAETSLSGGITRVQVHNATAGTSGVAATSSNVTYQAEADESPYPYQIGKTRLVGTVASDTKIGFVAQWNRVLTSDERTVMYEAVKRRFTALGVTI